jgi:hypothetical protein
MFLSVNEMLIAPERGGLDLHVPGNHVLVKVAEVTCIKSTVTGR